MWSIEKRRMELMAKKGFSSTDSVLRALSDWYASNPHKNPLLSELVALHVPTTTKQTIRYRLKQLEEMGHVQIIPLKKRGVRMVSV